MDGIERETEKPFTEGTVQTPGPRHRRWWRGLGASTMFLAVALLPWLIRNSVLRQYLYEIQQTRPEALARCVLQSLPYLWLVCSLGLQAVNLLRTYCFARAETAERIKLFDYLRSEPVRLRIAKYVYYDVWVLVAILLLLGVYYLLF